MTTTLEKYRGTRVANYCSLPRIDVEILPDVRTCSVCGQEVTFMPSTRRADGLGFIGGGYKHVGAAEHEAEPKARCRYCNSEDEVELVLAAWSNETRCSRCGGVDGFGLGD